MRQIIMTLLLLWFTSIAGAEVTFNPSDQGTRITLSNGNMTATKNATVEWCSVRVTESQSSGKFYFEIYINAVGAAQPVVGVSTAGQSVACGSSTYIGSTAYGWAWGGTGPFKFNNGATAYEGPGAATTGNVVMCAFDLDNDKIWVGKNGVWAGSPGDGTNAMFTNLTATGIYLSVSLCANSSVTLRATDAACVYSAPLGFSYIELPPAIGGTLKNKESDASGSAIDYLIVKRSDGTILDNGTSAASGTYSDIVPDAITEYDVLMIDLSAERAKIIGENVLGVE